MEENKVYDHKKIELTNNYLLVQLHDTFEKYHMNGQETEIRVGISTDDPEFRNAHNTQYSGVVISNPRKLIFNGFEIRKMIKKNKDVIFGAPSRYQAHLTGQISRMKNDSLKYKTDVLTKEGDIVHFDFMEKYEIYSSDRIIQTDIGPLAMLRYDSVNFIERGDEIIPVNTTVLFKWKRDDSISDTGIVKSLRENNIYDKDHGTITGEIISLPEPVQGLLADSSKSTYYDPVREMKVGDKFIVSRHRVTNAENENHFRIFGGEEVFIVKANDILCLI